MKLAPLRKITQVLRAADDYYGRQRVRLECGHEVSASAGAIYRARCRLCKERDQADKPSSVTNGEVEEAK